MLLIQTKTLIPKKRKHLLHRARLVDFLHEHVDRQLLLVSASAGYGKTSLLVDFASDAEMPVAWYSLDEDDRDLRTFLEYFVEAIEQIFPGTLGETRRTLSSSDGDFTAEAVAAVVVNDILQNIPDFFVLILDDYHLVDDITAINLFLDAFIRHQPDNCRIIVASRTIPTLTPRGMALLVAEQQVAGLGINELRFTAQEVRDLIQQNYGQQVTIEQAEELARESEGWITAILLTRQRMWKGLFADLIQAPGTKVGVYDYLANEIFEGLSRDQQEFLMSTSILDVMSPQLCNVVLGREDSAAILEELEDRNLFTTRVERGDEIWYRYHRLFREFLHSRLVERNAAREISLHIQAGRQLENEGHVADAIRHFLEAGAHRDAARAIAAIASVTYDAGRLDNLLAWIDALPEQIIRQTPALAWFKSKILWNRGDLPQSIVYADIAREGYQRTNDSLGIAQALVEKGAVLRAQGRFPEALDACREALAQLDGKELKGPDRGVLAGVYRNLGICHIQIGDIPLGTQELREALGLYEQADYQPNVAQTHSDLGVALRLAGNLSASHYHFEQALQIWEAERNPSGIASTLNSLGVSHHVRGEYEKALDVYDIALKRAREAASDRLSGLVLAGIGDTLLAQGKIDQAFEAYRDSQPLADRSGFAFLSGYLLGALANAHLLRGESREALDLARQAYERAREQGARQEAATYQIILGAVYYQHGRTRRSLDCLVQAVDVLRESQAHRDLARALLHQAQAYYRAGRVDEAQSVLEELTDTLLDLGQVQFLVPDARMAIALLQYAVKRRVGGTILAGLLEQTLAETQAVRQAPADEGSDERLVAVPPIRVHALGETRVLRGDEEIPVKAWGAAKARQLFFYLLSHAGQRKEQIADLFWPDSSPSKVRSAFHVTTYRVRHALKVKEAIVFEDDRYYLNREMDVWYDLWEFEQLLEDADQLDRQSPQAAAEKRREALELVRGEFCENMPDMDWISERRRSLNEQVAGALMRLGYHQLSEGDHGTALRQFQRAVEQDALNEEAHRQIMVCLAALGDRAGALRHYYELVDLLLEELSVDPDSETVQVFEGIASDDGKPV